MPNTPKGLTDEKATRMMTALHEGQTAREPSQDSKKRQENEEEKGENACPLTAAAESESSEHGGLIATVDMIVASRRGVLRRRVFDQRVPSVTIQPEKWPRYKA